MKGKTLMFEKLFKIHISSWKKENFRKLNPSLHKNVHTIV